MARNACQLQYSTTVSKTTFSVPCILRLYKLFIPNVYPPQHYMVAATDVDKCGSSFLPKTGRQNSTEINGDQRVPVPSNATRGLYATQHYTSGAVRPRALPRR